CVSIVAQTPAPGDSDSEGVLQRATEAYRAAKVKAQRIGEVVRAFAGAYYEDHIKPVADPYMDWASASTSSFWDRWPDTSPGDSDSRGFAAGNRGYRAAKVKAQRIGEVVRAFAGAYYEDHIKPVADPYMDWASASTSSFWDRVPEPDKELVEKYEDMKSVFYRRLLNAYSKLQAAVGPLTENMGQGQAAKDYIEELQGNPKFQSVEAAPLVDKARMAGLGLYGHYVRPHVGTYLDEAIKSIKVYLDKLLPAEN
ncbi:unnamed protein product, partial [Coregonus sp. 'balchen']